MHRFSTNPRYALSHSCFSWHGEFDAHVVCCVVGAVNCSRDLCCIVAHCTVTHSILCFCPAHCLCVRYSSKKEGPKHHPGPNEPRICADCCFSARPPGAGFVVCYVGFAISQSTATDSFNTNTTIACGRCKPNPHSLMHCISTRLVFRHVYQTSLCSIPSVHMKPQYTDLRMHTSRQNANTTHTHTHTHTDAHAHAQCSHHILNVLELCGCISSSYACVLESFHAQCIFSFHSLVSSPPFA